MVHSETPRVRLACGIHRITYPVNRYRPEVKRQLRHPGTPGAKIGQRMHTQFNRRLFGDENSFFLVQNVLGYTRRIHCASIRRASVHGVVCANHEPSSRRHHPWFGTDRAHQSSGRHSSPIRRTGSNATTETGNRDDCETSNKKSHEISFVLLTAIDFPLRGTWHYIRRLAAEKRCTWGAGASGQPA